MLQVRKNIRLPREHYLGTRWYFITICCHERIPHFTRADLSTWLVERLRENAATEAFRVHAYCVMPDHLHFLAEGASPQSDLVDFVRRFKQKTAHHAAQGFAVRPLWQRYFHDHVLRRDDAADAVAWYIWLNPVRKGLSTQPADYPFLGSFTGPGPTKQPAEWWTPPWKRKCRGQL